MKKILIFIAVLLISIAPSYAKNNHTVKFDGEKYTLLYSTKNPELGGYINEYYKRGETYNIWSEMIGVHHFPNAYSPIDQIIDFRKYLSSINCPSCISFDEDKNTGIIDFIMISENHAPVVMEFNIFKYTKSDKCGSVAIQYAKRYAVKNAFEAEEVKKEFTKTRKNALKKVEKMKVPDVVLEEIDKCAVKKDNSAVEKISPKTEEKQEKAKENIEEITEEKEVKAEEAKETESVTNKEETDINNAAEESTVIEEQQEKAENTAVEKKQETKVEKTKKDDSLEEKHAPVPVEDNVKENKKAEKVKNNKEVKKIKNKKEIVEKAKKKKNDKNAYKLENTKDQYYAQPRDYKEIVAECKRLQKEQKKLKKANAKKAAKERAKKASKKLAE